MSSKTIATVLTLGVLGVGAALGIGLAANAISGDSIGLSAEPLRAGDTLSPPTSSTAVDSRTTTTGRTTSTATTTTTPPATSTEPGDDNSGSGSGDSGQGRGRGRGRGRGGDDD